MQNIPLEEAYATIAAKPDPFTIRTKKLVDEFVVSDINTDRSCEKETVLDNGRRVVMKGTYCASTFVGKLYKMNGPSENLLERYVLFVGVARQNPIDNRQDGDLAVEMAAENAMVNPIMTIKLPNAISGTDFARFEVHIWIQCQLSLFLHLSRLGIRSGVICIRIGIVLLNHVKRKPIFFYIWRRFDQH